MPLSIPSRIEILGQSAAAVTAPADVNENTLGTINVPALGPDDRLRVNLRWTMTNNVNVKTLRARFSGAAGTTFLSSAISSVAAATNEVEIANRGVTNSQVGGFRAVSGAATLSASAAAVTSAVDTSVPTTLVITGQKAVGTDTLTLESYSVERIRG